MSEMNITLNANQTALYKAYRAEYTENQRLISNLKEDIKLGLEGLVEGLGWDTKTHKAEIKALKKSLALYVKQEAESELKNMEEAVALASL